MSILEKEYPEMDMSKLKAGMDIYMNEQDTKNNQQKEPAQNANKVFIGPEEAASGVDQVTKVTDQAADQPTKAFQILLQLSMQKLFKP